MIAQSGLRFLMPSSTYDSFSMLISHDPRTKATLQFIAIAFGIVVPVDIL